jgi:predicted deacylase
VIRNGKGPTTLVLGGNHGDEYPGPIAILKLMREVQPADVQGTLVLMPTLNLFCLSRNWKNASFGLA